MKKEDVLSNGMFKVVEKKGAMFDNLQMVVPLKYDHVSRAKKNLFVATIGSVNAYRTYGIEATFEENDRPYGKYFSERLINKTLDTEVHFYTIDGQIPMKDKIRACLACLNDDMIVLLKEDYTWSIALIDYDAMTITDVEECCNVKHLKSDYTSRRFLVGKEEGYSVVYFDTNSKVTKVIPLYDKEPIAFNGDGMIVKKDGKFGFVKNDGEFVLNCTWDRIRLHNEYIEAVWNNRTAIYLYNGYCVWYEEIKSYEELYIKGKLLFKVKYKNGYCGLYSLEKQILPVETESIEILSDGSAIMGFASGGFALTKYDPKSNEFNPVLPMSCFKNKAKLFDGMSFVVRKEGTTVEVVKGSKIAYYDTEGNQLTKFKYYI